MTNFLKVRKSALVFEDDLATARALSIQLARALDREWGVTGSNTWLQARTSAEKTRHDVVVLGTDGKTQPETVAAFVRRVNMMCPGAAIVLRRPNGHEPIVHEAVSVNVSKGAPVETLAAAIRSAAPMRRTT